MKGFTKLGRTLLALAVLAIMPLSVSAQDFIQAATGTYNATCGGVIKINAVGGKIDNSSGNALGTVAKPVPGVVDFAADAGTQIVHAFYYSSLFLSGSSAKTVQDGIFVTGECTTGFLPAYAALSNYPYVATGGNRTYNGTFSYAGGNQNIFPEYTVAGSQPNNYNNLNLQGTGIKTVRNNDEIGVVGIMTLAASNDLAVLGTLNTGLASTLAGDVAINGDGIINIGNGLFTFNGTLDVTADGTLNAGDGGIFADGLTTISGNTALINVGSGPVTFDAVFNITNGSLTAADGVTGDVTLTANSTTTIAAAGNLNFGANTDLIITGGITNNGSGSNLDFACNSNVLYNGAAGQLVMPTVSGNEYGNLTLSGGNKTMLTGPSNSGWDVYLCGNFAMNGGGMFDIYKGGTNEGTLFMITPTANATYAGLEEVIGTFNRTTNASALTYSLNNGLTEVSLEAAATNPTSIQTRILPGTESVNPEQYAATTDVRRKITYTYTGNSGDFDYDMQVGYLYTEGPNGGAWGGLTTEANLRMYEANAGGVEKVGTGVAPIRTPAVSAPNMGSILVSGIGNTTTTALDNGIGLFASTNDVLLRSGPTTFYSVNSGRWTNPNTWDEGAAPKQDDNAEIRHVVYVGIDGPFAGTNGGTDGVAEDNRKAELDEYGSDPAANEILISGEATYATNTPSLVIGNEDNGATYIFKTKATGVSFTNNNTLAPAAAFNATNGLIATYATKGDVPAPATAKPFNGVWLVQYVVGTNPGTPQFQTNQIDNKGTINNEGVISVGNTTP